VELVEVAFVREFFFCPDSFETFDEFSASSESCQCGRL
jgi:hypothetical protein